ncbi:hypothetical protein SDC9_183492 [bioreactor metagenome]|uniref:Uncharacterized protein n=1 Tax=bioreactor metagenome TaxID=1076179 RepID=A0A645HAC7_9ZZZZ
MVIPDIHAKYFSPVLISITADRRWNVRPNARRNLKKMFHRVSLFVTLNLFKARIQRQIAVAVEYRVSGVLKAFEPLHFIATGLLCVPANEHISVQNRQFGGARPVANRSAGQSGLCR